MGDFETQSSKFVLAVENLRLVLLNIFLCIFADLLGSIIKVIDTVTTGLIFFDNLINVNPEEKQKHEPEKTVYEEFMININQHLDNEKKKREFISEGDAIELGNHIFEIEEIIRDYPDEDWGDYILEKIRVICDE